MPESPVLRIGVSACLLGQMVRYDGGHKQHAPIVEILSQWAELIPVCPEVAIGLTVPREPIRLEERGGSVHAVKINSRTDVSKPLRDYGMLMASSLAGISGYIFKSKSPSCGLASVSVYDSEGSVSRTGAGLFAAEIMHAFPQLPVVEESELVTLKHCERFMECVRAYQPSVTAKQHRPEP